MATEYLDYPKARCALGAGDLMDCYDVNGSAEDGEKSVATLRRNPGGSTGGARSGNVTLKSAISEEGFERDWMGKWRKREVVQLRIKVPGLTWVFTGRLTKPTITSNVDGFIDFQISLVAALSVDKIVG